ncbi:NADH dehydrogenase [Microvirga subterranea]|uniref:NADH:ubiquinone reductase (non-electrogenic) n=1 Tax=Microvirga subterranea TaxID=186651 RepID=A0A370HIE6_9HYPH|nr:NADH dehydrogenase [Microvirga subterranea]
MGNEGSFWRTMLPSRRRRDVPEPSPSDGHHVVVIGAGFAGLSLAQTLGSTPFRVTLVDRRNYHLFQPLLYQVATAVLTPGEIAEPVRRIMKRHPNVHVLLGELDGIDPQRREVRIDGDILPYDTLVLATGATHSYFGHPEWEPFAPGLKTLEDARQIRAKVLLAFERAEREPDPAERERLMTFAVIGGGPTGVEMAGAIAGLARQSLARDFRTIDPAAARILLIEAAPRILGPFPEDLSAYAERALQHLGVTILTGRPVEAIDENGITLGGERIATATVIWAAGVAASPVGAMLGVGTDRAGRVRVGPDLSVPGLDGVYVLGDLALAHDEKGRPLPGLAQVAHQEGIYLGKALKARILRGEAPAPFRFRSRGNLAVIGRNEAVVHWETFKLKGFAAWLVWGIAHVYLLVGFQNRLLVSLRWLWSYLTHQYGSRIIDEDTFRRCPGPTKTSVAFRASQVGGRRDRAKGHQGQGSVPDPFRPAERSRHGEQGEV